MCERLISVTDDGRASCNRGPLVDITSAQLIAALGEDLAAHAVEKGTIRFPLDEPVPVKLIARIVKYRAKEVARKGAAT